MYGLVNKAIKDLVAENHGDEVSQQCCEIEEFKEDYEGHFNCNLPND